jgi:hypothetical protein
LDPEGRIIARREFHADSDREALIAARVLYARRAMRHGFELWEKRRHVRRAE